MKTIAALVLLIACSQALDLSKLKPMRKNSPVLNPKYTGFKWDRIKRNQVIAPIVYPGYKQGTKPQPANAGHALPHKSRIIGGEQATRGQFPWQAIITMDQSYLCGGSLVSDVWVLSAGHCGHGFNSFYIQLGKQNIYHNEDGEVSVTTTDKIVHEGYDENTINNDISLMKLPQKVTFTMYIAPVKLPSYSMASNDLVGDTVTISGWGKTSDNSGVSDELMYVSMIVMENSECANYYGDVITSSKICTDTTDGHSTCNGDSGGPLTVQANGVSVEVGIVSFGSSAGCESGYPAAFTRVTSFLQWIETNSGIKIDN